MTKVERDVYNEILKRGLIAEDVLGELSAGVQQSDDNLLSSLESKGHINETDLLQVISDITGLSFISLNDTVIEESAIRAVTVRVAWHYEFMPLNLEGKRLTIAVNRPLSVRRQDEIRLSLGYEIKTVLARKDQIKECLKTYYGLGADTVDRLVGRDVKGRGAEDLLRSTDIEDIEKKAGDASVVRLVNQIILEAFRKRSTDIHIEPFRGKLALRYRIDGVLHAQPVSGDFSKFLAPILSRVKIMANLNIVERRVPQDGRAIVRIQDQVLDLRVSYMPTPHGESVVIRILPSKRRFNLQELGLLTEDVKIFEDILKQRSGIVFVTGPTGSGKTTTLYTCIDRINTEEKKIITIEDPIEYEMSGIVQIQVNPDVGLTFARGLRSMLRHDPDVMMVGEVRDKETAEIATRVALTGHLVLSTIHTNDAASGVTRLIDIGVPPYLIASTVRVFIAQRLVRVICPSCKYDDTGNYKDLAGEIKEILGDKHTGEVRIFKGKGCEKCDFTGFFGRTALYEILPVDDDIRHMIIERCSAIEIKKKAVEKGMKILLHDGYIKVAGGMTTPEEVMNVSGY